MHSYSRSVLSRYCDHTCIYMYMHVLYMYIHDYMQYFLLHVQKMRALQDRVDTLTNENKELKVHVYTCFNER